VARQKKPTNQSVDDDNGTEHRAVLLPLATTCERLRSLTPRLSTTRQPSSWTRIDLRFTRIHDFTTSPSLVPIAQHGSRRTKRDVQLRRCIAYTHKNDRTCSKHTSSRHATPQCDPSPTSREEEIGQENHRGRRAIWC
jgi:hypothetical protein